MFSNFDNLRLFLELPQISFSLDLYLLTSLDFYYIGFENASNAKY